MLSFLKGDQGTAQDGLMASPDEVLGEPKDRVSVHHFRSVRNAPWSLGEAGSLPPANTSSREAERLLSRPIQAFAPSAPADDPGNAALDADKGIGAPAPEAASRLRAVLPEGDWEQLLQGSEELFRKAQIRGRLRLPASEHDCELTELSEEGMTLAAPEAVVTPGVQVTLMTQDLPLLLGVVTSQQHGNLVVRFARPLTADVLAKVAQLRRRIRGPRAGRADLELPSSVYFDGVRHVVVVRNISAGGLMMTTQLPVRRGQRKLVRTGQALMIHFPELLPVGGHVRWTCGGTCGVMFSKLLSQDMAEDIARLAGLPGSWIDDVRLAREDFEDCCGSEQRAAA